MAPDLNRIVTEQDIMGALVSLGSIPKRDSKDVELDLAAYCLALEGVRAATLVGAVHSIIRGELGHAFFPAPPELRIQCNRIDRERAESEAKARLSEKRRLEAAAFPTVEHSEASKARVKAIYQGFLGAHAAAKLEAASQGRGRRS